MALDNGVSADDEDEEGRGGIHAATYNRHSEIVRELVHRGADVTSVHPVYGNPLVLVLEGLLKDQLLRLESADDGGELQAGLTRRSKALRALQEFPIFFDRSPEISYQQLAECEQIVKYLLDSGAKCDHNSEPFGTALHLAAFMGSETIVLLLLDHGADINASGGPFGTPLLAALAKNNLGVVETLLEREADVQRPSGTGITPLLTACRKGSKSAVRILLLHGADINAADKDGQTALTAALRFQKENGTSHDRPAPLQGKVLEILIDTLSKHDGGIKVDEGHLCQAAKVRPIQGLRSALESLLDYDKNLVVSEKVVITVLRRFPVDRGLLRLLLSRSGNLGVTTAMLEAMSDADGMEDLLGHNPVCKITPSVLETQHHWSCVEKLHRDSFCFKYSNNA